MSAAQSLNVELDGASHVNGEEPTFSLSVPIASAEPRRIEWNTQMTTSQKVQHLADVDSLPEITEALSNENADSPALELKAPSEKLTPSSTATDEHAHSAAAQSELSASEMIAEPDNAEDETPADTLTPEVIAQYAREAGVRTFLDQHRNAFAWIAVGDVKHRHCECLRIRSADFRSRLLELINRRTECLPKMSALKQAIEVMELEAYRSSRERIENRRTAVDDEVFIDMGDDGWQMIHINRNRWKVMPQDRPMFSRPQHMLSLPIPQRGGDMDRLFDFVPAENDGERLLMKAWLLGGLYPSIPNPILLFVGQHGSAKTTRSQRLRSLLDPSITPLLGHLDMSNLFQTFQHHAVPCFENVSHFSRREADMFCRAVTGDGVGRRKLYTDGDQVLYFFRRPIIINGLDSPSTRADFLDRCLIYNCRRMDEFIPLDKLDREFEAARPGLLGAMLDLLVRTLDVLHVTPPANDFRMADFAWFGRAVAVASGLRPEDFDEAYRMNIRQQNFEVLEDAPMCRVLEKFAAEYASAKPWVGTAEQLLAMLRKVARLAGDEDGRHDLPKSASALGKRLGARQNRRDHRGGTESENGTTRKIRVSTRPSTILR